MLKVFTIKHEKNFTWVLQLLILNNLRYLENYIHDLNSRLPFELWKDCIKMKFLKRRKVKVKLFCKLVTNVNLVYNLGYKMEEIFTERSIKHLCKIVIVKINTRKFLQDYNKLCTLL